MHYDRPHIYPSYATIYCGLDAMTFYDPHLLFTQLPSACSSFQLFVNYTVKIYLKRKISSVYYKSKYGIDQF